MEGKYYLTATDLMNYSYCPRIIYFVHVLKIPQATTTKEYKGREKETDFQHKAKRTKVVKKYPKLPKMFKVKLSSEKLRMKTIVDSIMINKEKEEAYPIQAKYSYTPRSVYQTQKNQLALESLLVEDKLNMKSPFGFIKFLKSGDLVKVSTEKREPIFEIFEKITEIVEKEKMPKPTNYKKRCVDCCFKNVC